MKEDSDGNWYHCADVDARARLEDEVNGKLRERIVTLREALLLAACPRSIEDDDGSIGCCLKSGHCGCVYRTLEIMER